MRHPVDLEEAVSNIRALPVARRVPAAWAFPPEPAQAAVSAPETLKARAELLGDLNHDLRAPLNGIIGLTLALDATSLSPAQRELVELIRVSGQKLDSLLGELLATARERATAPAEPSRPRILVVDDQAINRAAAAIILEALGAEIVEAADGEEAVSLYADDNFDLVIMDVEMPRLDGLAAVRAIRYLEREEGRARTPVFMLTARGGPDAETASLAAGACLHITKPATGPRLLAAAEAALGCTADSVVRRA
jgi:CheY-like chemotaxis protein